MRLGRGTKIAFTAFATLVRLHHDFEVANDAFLSKGRGDANTLAYPFLVFVQQKLTRERRA